MEKIKIIIYLKSNKNYHLYYIKILIKIIYIKYNMVSLLLLKILLNIYINLIKLLHKKI